MLKSVPRPRDPVKNISAVVTPGDQMVKAARDLNPKSSCHIVANENRDMAESQA